MKVRDVMLGVPMSTITELRKGTELKRCVAAEMHWSKYDLSPTSPDWKQIRRLSSTKKYSVDGLSAPRFSTAIIIYIIIIIIIIKPT